MARSPLDEALQVLRAARRRELDALFQDGWPTAARGESPMEQPLASAARVHDDATAVLARIDAAEQSMRPVLQAWARDPARRGAHLLQTGRDDHDSEPERHPAFDPTSEPTIPAGSQAPDLPDTIPAPAPKRPG